MRALSFFRLFYEEFTLYQARLKRLYEFLYRLDDLTTKPLNGATTVGDTLILNHFSLLRDDGSPLILPISLSLQKGERLLIQGASGTGKTMLLKAMAGICPFATIGTLQIPTERAFFVPQRVYMPQGKLKDALCYPDICVNDDVLIQMMISCRLDKWVHKLDVTANWQTTLSLGELQRVAFVRVFLTSPKVLYLDEATSALDEPTEDLMYRQILDKLPHTIVISVGHRSTLHKFHQKQLILTQTYSYHPPNHV